MILQLNPPLWFDTPKGRALAHFVVDTGMEHEMEFVCFQQNGEVWSWSQRDVRAAPNVTLGRGGESPPQTRTSHIAAVDTRKE